MSGNSLNLRNYLSADSQMAGHTRILSSTVASAGRRHACGSASVAIAMCYYKAFMRPHMVRYWREPLLVYPMCFVLANAGLEDCS